jgi:hypothetical protein
MAGLRLGLLSGRGRTETLAVSACCAHPRRLAGCHRWVGGSGSAAWQQTEFGLLVGSGARARFGATQEVSCASATPVEALNSLRREPTACLPCVATGIRSHEATCVSTQA